MFHERSHSGAIVELLRRLFGEHFGVEIDVAAAFNSEEDGVFLAGVAIEVPRGILLLEMEGDGAREVGDDHAGRDFVLIVGTEPYKFFDDETAEGVAVRSPAAETPRGIIHDVGHLIVGDAEAESLGEAELGRDAVVVEDGAIVQILSAEMEIAWVDDDDVLALDGHGGILMMIVPRHGGVLQLLEAVVGFEIAYLAA